MNWVIIKRRRMIEFGLRPIGAYAYAPVGSGNGECGMRKWECGMGKAEFGMGKGEETQGK
jgi:hypothetical protein